MPAQLGRQWTLWPMDGNQRGRFLRRAFSRMRHFLPHLELLTDRIAPALVSWDGGGGDYDWNNAQNWSGDALPTSVDDVVIDVPYSLTVTHSAGATSIRQLTSQANLTLAGGTFSIAQPSTIQRELTISGATLSGSGNLSVAGVTYWNSGAITGTGQFNANGGVWILTAAAKTVSGRDIHLAGGYWVGGDISVDDGAVLTVNAGTIFDIKDNNLLKRGAGTGTASLVNLGSIEKSNGTGTTVFGANVAFTNAGVVQLESGTLQLDQASTHSGSIVVWYGTTLDFHAGAHVLTASASVTGNGDLRVSGGSLTTLGPFTPSGPLSVLAGASANLAGNPTLNQLTLGGTLNNSGNLIVQGQLTWTGGTIAGTGDITAGGGIDITTTTGKLLSGKRLVLAGGGTWTNGDIAMDDSAILDVPGNQSLVQLGNNSLIRQTNIGGADFLNDGSFIKAPSASGLSVFSAGVNVINNGTITASDGTIVFEGSGTYGGTIQLLNGAVAFNGGNIVLTSAGTITGNGQLLVNSGTVTFDSVMAFTGGVIQVAAGATAFFNRGLGYNGNVTIDGTATVEDYSLCQQLTINGTMLGAGNISIATAMVWNAGAIDGAGSFDTISLSLASAASKSLKSKRIQINGNYDGVMTVSGGDLRLDNGAQIDITEGGLLDFQSDASIVRNTGIGAATLTNDGTLRKSGGTGATTIGANIVFTNNGTIDVQIGTLTILSNLNNFSGNTLSGGNFLIAGTLKFPGANVVTNETKLTLTGPSSSLLNSNNNANGLANLATNTEYAVLTVQGGRNLTVSGSFANQGIVNIGAGSIFATASGNYSQTDNLTRVNGTLDPAGTFELSGGFLYGVGNVLASVNVSSWGEIRPGNSPGELTIVGDVAFSGGGFFKIDLDGTTPGSQFDRLSVQGTINLNNSGLYLVRHFSGVEGQSFIVIANDGADPIVNTFGGLGEGDAFTVDGTTYSISYLAGSGGNDVQLTITARDTTPPEVVDVGDVSPDPRNYGVSYMYVTFSEPIDLTTFNAADIVLTRNGTPVTFSGNETFYWDSGYTYVVEGLYEETDQQGNYAFTVQGSGIADYNGNAGFGSATDSWIADYPPEVVAFNGPDSYATATASSIEIVLSEVVNLSTFTIADCVLNRDFDFGTNLLTGAETLSLVSGTTYRISGLAPLTGLDGDYQFYVDMTGVQDLNGNAGTNDAAYFWSKDSTPPLAAYVADISPNPRNAPVPFIDFSFTEAVDLATLSFADCSLTRNGGPNLLTSEQTVAQLSGSTYRISNLTALTAADGTYVFSFLGADVKDLYFGNSGGGSATTTWIMDTVPLTVLDIVDVAPDPRRTSVASIDIVLSEVVDLATFTAADCFLAKDYGLNLLTGSETITYVGGTTYRINGVAGLTANEGDYVFVVFANGILDMSGTAGSGVGADNWTVDLTPVEIVGVYLDATAWTPAFRAAAGTAIGYNAQTGPGQLTPLPWRNLNTIRVQFGAAVNVVAASLGIRGINVANYSMNSFSYDPATFVASWTISGVFNTDRLILDLDADGASAVTDLAGNMLMGDWTDSVSSFPTSGAAGTDFRYRFVVAVGDADRNGIVRNSDLNLVRNNLFVDVGTLGYSIFADIDGNGQIRNADVNTVRASLFVDPPGGPGPFRPGRGRTASNPVDRGRNGARFVATPIDYAAHKTNQRRLGPASLSLALDAFFESV